jgi:hypothetical protein
MSNGNIPEVDDRLMTIFVHSIVQDPVSGYKR